MRSVGARRATADELAGAEWWNGLSRAERRYWLELVDEHGDASVAKAWAEYKRQFALIERATRP